MEVVLYHQQTCPQCKAVESMLKRANIQYISNTDIDYMQSIGVKTTPTLGVDGNLLKGKDIITWIKNQ